MNEHVHVSTAIWSCRVFSREIVTGNKLGIGTFIEGDAADLTGLASPAGKDE